MKKPITTTFLGGAWLSFGFFVAINGIILVATALLLPHINLNIELSQLPAPMDLLVKDAFTIGLVQFLTGVALAMGGALLKRKKRGGKLMLQTLSVALMIWFLFLGAYIHLASQRSQEVLFPPLLPICFGVITMGVSLWALSRLRITGDE